LLLHDDDLLSPETLMMPALVTEAVDPFEAVLDVRYHEIANTAVNRADMRQCVVRMLADHEFDAEISFNEDGLTLSGRVLFRPFGMNPVTGSHSVLFFGR
jgi:hypothetical protein